MLQENVGVTGLEMVGTEQGILLPWQNLQDHMIQYHMTKTCYGNHTFCYDAIKNTN